jgi:hypothetical protein
MSFAGIGWLGGLDKIFGKSGFLGFSRLLVVAGFRAKVESEQFRPAIVSGMRDHAVETSTTSSLSGALS